MSSSDTPQHNFAYLFCINSRPFQFHTEDDGI